MTLPRTPEGWRDLLLRQLAHRAAHAPTQALRDEANGELGAVRALIADAARLDWIDEHADEVWYLRPSSDPAACTVTWCTPNGCLADSHGHDVRGAIDDARSPNPPRVRRSETRA